MLCNVVCPLSVTCSVFFPVCCYMAAGIALYAGIWVMSAVTLMEGDCTACKGRLQMGRPSLSLAQSLPRLLTSAVMTPDIRCTLSVLSHWTYTQGRLLWVCFEGSSTEDLTFNDSTCIFFSVQWFSWQPIDQINNC